MTEKPPKVRPPRLDAMTPDQSREADVIVFAMTLAGGMRDPGESPLTIARALVKLRGKARKHSKRVQAPDHGAPDLHLRGIAAAQSHVDGLLACIAGEVAQNAMTAQYQEDGSVRLTAYDPDTRAPKIQIFFG